jgi:hypothetical protein
MVTMSLPRGVLSRQVPDGLATTVEVEDLIVSPAREI